MKALSIKQPWASLIANGIKDIENRTWKTNFRGRIYIHASSKPASWNDLNSQQRKLVGISDCRQWDLYSAIIGEVDVIDCVINHESIWAEKISESDFQLSVILNVKPKPIYNWVLANAVFYDKPIFNAKGKLSFWEFEK